ncbi:6-bladed beta-propeller [Parabacteroides sp. AM08-6]|uniref:6-bladed beta-propeller n=1 Tax=Parabacteroides sp. AM08-6 TaxID=2292053 RepID=UPI000F002E87|nr:6-bladed beta-propeller [Parabacteroides sp. AM08-6]RHJ86630.1 6-bladed beta-propeller [Parabacteroides sp. AM08-6]
MKTEIIFLFVVVLFGCKGTDKNKLDVDYIYIPSDKITTLEKIDFDEPLFIDSCSFIPLETISESVIGEIKQIKIYDNKIYIFDVKTRSIKVFNIEGRYLCDIGKQGQGDKEYISINSFFINTDENKVCIVDPLKKCVHEYGLNGDYIRNVKPKVWGFHFPLNLVYSDKFLYCAFSLSYNNDKVYTKMSSEDYSVIEEWSTYPLKLNTQMSVVFLDNPFSIVNTEMHYTSLFSDTIYKYGEDEKKPYLVIETGKPNVPFNFVDGKSYEYEPVEALAEISSFEKYSPGFSLLLETDRFVFTKFDLNKDFYVIDKKTEKAYHVITPPYQLDIMSSKCINGNDLIKVFDQEEISNYLQYVETEGVKYPKQIQNVISNYDLNEGNPVILIYHIKK